MVERVYDLWDKDGNCVGKIKCEKDTLKELVERVPKIVDSSVAEAEFVRIQEDENPS